MKQTRIILGLIFFLMAFGLAATKEPSSFLSLQAFGSSPTGDFDNTIGEGAGYAETGFGIGVEYSDPTGIRNLFWALNGGLILNDFDENALIMFMPGVDGKIGYWINIPFLTGLKYEFGSTPDFRVFTSALLGLNILKPPDWKLEFGSETIEVDFDFAFDFAYGVCFETIIYRKFNIGIRFLDLGDPELDYSVEAGESTTEILHLKQPVSMTVFFFGYVWGK